MAALDPVGLLSTPPYNILIIVAIIGIGAYYIFSRRKNVVDDVFEIEDFRESVFMSTEKLMKNFGIKISGHMMRGIEPIGQLQKFYNYKGTVKLDLPTDKQTTKKKTEDKQVSLWIIATGKVSFIGKYIPWLFPIQYEYVILKREQLGEFDPNRRMWPIKEDVSLSPYGNVFIASKEAEAFCNDVSFRRTAEEMLTHVQNFPRKLAYLELKQAKVMERFSASIEKKSVGYDMYRKSVLGAGKELDPEAADDE